MNVRERKSMHLLKQLFDAYYELPLSERRRLRETLIEKKIHEIKPVLKLYKEDIGKEISAGVVVNRKDNKKGIFVAAYDNESGEIIVL